jgi:hypothetical protein
MVLDYDSYHGQSVKDSHCLDTYIQDDQSSHHYKQEDE